MSRLDMASLTDDEKTAVEVMIGYMRNDWILVAMPPSLASCIENGLATQYTAMEFSANLRSVYDRLERYEQKGHA